MAGPRDGGKDCPIAEEDICSYVDLPAALATREKAPENTPEKGSRDGLCQGGMSKVQSDPYIHKECCRSLIE